MTKEPEKEDRDEKKAHDDADDNNENFIDTALITL